MNSNGFIAGLRFNLFALVALISLLLCATAFADGVEALLGAIQMHHDDEAMSLLEQNTNLVYGNFQSKTILNEAAAAGNLAIVKRLVELGADINSQGDILLSSGSHNTPLHWAIDRNHPEVCKYLLEAGADPNRMAFSFDTTLHLAFSKGHEEMAGWLLDYGAAPFQGKLFANDETTPFELDITKSSGRLVPRMLGQDSQHSLGTKSLQKPRRSNRPTRGMKTAAEVLKQHGSELLEIAATRGELEAVEALFKADVTVSNSADGLTAMQSFALASVAAQNSRPGAEQRLHELQSQLKQDYIANADKGFVESLRFQEKSLEKELASLAPERWQKILNLLVKHHVDYDALAATALDDTNQIARILSTRKDAARSQDFAGNTPLHWAVQNDRLPLTSLWIQAGIPLNATNSSGQTALHLAAARENIWFMKSLLAAHAAADICDNAGQTPLHIAAAHGKIEFVKILLAANAPTGIRDTNGLIPLDAAIQAKQSDVIHILMADKSAPAHPERGFAITLHKAAATGNIAALVALVESETNLEVRDELGLTPLQVAVTQGHLAAAALLVDKGADINVRDPDGNTLLHQIFLQGRFSVRDRPPTNWLASLKESPHKDEFIKYLTVGQYEQGPNEILQGTSFLLACGLNAQATNHAGETVMQLITDEKTSRSVFYFDDDREKLFKLLGGAGVNIDQRDADGNTALHRLCSGFYDISKVEQMVSLIAGGADVNATNNLGQTPLHIASEKIGLWDDNNPPINAAFQLLIYKKANVNAQDNEGRTPLHVLAAGDSSFKKEATRLLLDYGADSNLKDKHGRTPVHLFLSGEWPWREASECVGMLMKAGANLSAKDNEGKTPLHYLAALGSQSPMFFIHDGGDTLIAAKVNLEERDNEGNTPLIIAIKKGTTDVFDWLVKQGADLDATNNVGQTPRILALKDGNRSSGIGRGMPPFSPELDIFQAIQEGKDNAIEHILNANAQLANTPDRTGQTPLRAAVMLNRTNIVSLLEARGVKWDAPSAVIAGRADLVRKILKEQPAAIAESANSESLLHLAAISGNVNIIQQLLAAGADLQAVDSFGLSPLGRARLKSQTAAVNLLVAHGATNNYFDAIYLDDDKSVSQYLSRNKSLANATNKARVTPVEIAAAAGFAQVLQPLLKAGGRANALPARVRTNSPATVPFNRFMPGVSPISWTTTPLNLAAFYNRTNEIEILIRAGADVNQADSRGFTPLHFAVLRNNFHALSLLLEHKANPNVPSAQFFYRPRMPGARGFDMTPDESQTPNGETPLHLAAMLGKTNIINFLLKSGANVNLNNGSARTPLDEAEMTGRSFRVNITPPAMLKPLEPLGLFQEQVFVTSVSPEDLKSTAAMIVAAGGQHSPRFIASEARYSSPSVPPTGGKKPTLADGMEFHISACNNFNSHNFTNALADFRKSAELGSSYQDYTYYRIWIIRSRLGEKEAANSELNEYLEHRKASDVNAWSLQIGRYLTGKLTETNLLEAANSPNQQTAKEQHCEAFFYVGSKNLLEGDQTRAIENFKKCKTTNLTDFEEYQSATSELLQLDKSAVNLK